MRRESFSAAILVNFRLRLYKVMSKKLIYATRHCDMSSRVSLEGDVELSLDFELHCLLKYGYQKVVWRLRWRWAGGASHLSRYLHLQLFYSHENISWMIKTLLS